MVATRPWNCSSIMRSFSRSWSSTTTSAPTPTNVRTALTPKTPAPRIATRAAGIPGTPFSQLALDISDRGDGAGNQAFVDEIVPYDDQMAFLKYAMRGSVQGEGIVATSLRDNPTLEIPGMSFLGRGAHFAFGLEGVNNELIEYVEPTYSIFLPIVGWPPYDDPNPYALSANVPTDFIPARRTTAPARI